jgi:hypothetical protein
LILGLNRQGDICDRLPRKGKEGRRPWGCPQVHFKEAQEIQPHIAGELLEDKKKKKKKKKKMMMMMREYRLPPSLETQRHDYRDWFFFGSFEDGRGVDHVIGRASKLPQPVCRLRGWWARHTGPWIVRNSPCTSSLPSPTLNPKTQKLNPLPCTSSLPSRTMIHSPVLSQPSKRIQSWVLRRKQHGG